MLEIKGKASTAICYIYQRYARRNREKIAAVILGRTEMTGTPFRSVAGTGGKSDEECPNH